MKKIIIAFWLSFVFCFNAHAAVYYIDPVNGDDDDDGTTQALAWATFAYAQSGGNPNQLSAGDTLYLMDGTFTEFLDITISGTEEGGAITFKALNDGSVTVDGENSRATFEILGTAGTHLEYIDVEGIVFTNSSVRSLYIAYSDNINVKRCSFYDNDSASNPCLIALESSYILMEDCIVKGLGSYTIQLAGQNSTFLTLRRVVSWHMGGGAGGRTAIQLYPPSDSTVENCIAIIDSGDTGITNIGGIAIGNSFSHTCDRNSIYGCVVRGDNKLFQGYNISSSAKHNIFDNKIIHSVDIESIRGLYQRADSNLVLENLTLIGVDTTDTLYGIIVFPNLVGGGNDGDFECNGSLKNSSILTANEGLEITDLDPTDDCIETWTHDYINIYDCNTNYVGNDGKHTEGANSTTIDPNYGTDTYGDGAFLMASQCDLAGTGESGADMGAEVLYQYEDGELTATPLFPWAMEDRIFAETGISVTWEANGGIWKTLDGVYSVPVVSFAEPDIGGDTVQVGDNYNIVYTLTDADYVGTSTGFYYDTDETGFDGTLIHADTVGLAEGTSQTYIWDTTGMAAGVYFIYGEVANDNSDTGQAYANGTLTINASIP
jgi:hypothetical protein